MDAMAWAPLIFLTIDSLLDEPCFKWILVGVFALSMQALAGYPQVLYDTIVTGAIYGAIRLVRAPRPVRTVLALSIVGVSTALICAGQLWVGAQAAAEGTRAGGTSFAFASSFSLSYDALLTLLVPGFFGDFFGTFHGGTGAWGGAAGVNLFFGLTGLTMAILGTRVKSPHRGAWIVTAVVLLFIALGHRTPLFGLFYRFVPGFNLFRRPAAFTFQLTLFLAMLSAFGMDAMIRSGGAAKTAALGLLTIGLALGVFGAVAHTGVSVTLNAVWRDLVELVATFAETLVSRNYDDPAFLAETERFAGGQCLIAAGTCLVLAGLLFVRPRHPQAAYILAVFGVAEAFGFAHITLTTFSLAATVPAQVQQLVAAHPGDYRILNPGRDGMLLPIANSAIPAGADDISGYDPTESRRYSEFIYYSQGLNPDDADMGFPFKQVSPMWRILRLRYLIAGDKITPIRYMNWGNRVFQLPIMPSFPIQLGDLPHVLLVDGWRRIEHRDDIFSALVAPSFDPTKTVILESDPTSAPMQGKAPGTARILSTTTDSLTIAADVTRPELLLITDSYSRYWRAVALTGSSQSEYQVMPADYTVMAVPLAPGHHLLRLEYAPSGWIIGRWISLASLLLYAAAVIWWLLSARRSRPQGLAN
jgi:hypothetical protein